MKVSVSYNDIGFVTSTGKEKTILNIDIQEHEFKADKINGIINAIFDAAQSNNNRSENDLKITAIFHRLGK